MASANFAVPRITRAFMHDIEKNSRNGIYRVAAGGIPIDVFPVVFPPQSLFSESSQTVFSSFPELFGKRVLDIGTGTGILAIQAVLAGAESIEAVDIDDNAVKCARHNVKLNNLQGKIKVFKSNLFSKVKMDGKFDLIIANLPIVDYPVKDRKFFSLFDPGFKFHNLLFRQAKKFLALDGRIILCHANLQRQSGFKRLEKLALNNGFEFNIAKTIHSLGFEWRLYVFSEAKLKTVRGVVE